jgi:hypothetical protein
LRPATHFFSASDTYAAQWPSVSWNVFLRINSALDRRYVGSVIVMDANRQHFESAAPFNVLVGGAVPWR